jgi:hypothetical protein
MRARLLVGLFLASFATGCGGAPPLTPDEIVAAFIARNTDPARTYHSELTGTYSSGGPGKPGSSMTMAMTATFDFHGDDYAGTIATQVGAAAGVPTGFNSSVSYVGIGDLSWIRHEGDQWQRIPADAGAAPTSFDVLPGLSPSDVAYDSAETKDGVPLHRIRLNDPGAVFRRALETGPGMSLTVADGSEYFLYVDGAGVPVVAQSRLVASMTFGDGLPPVNGPALPVMPQSSFELSFDHAYSGWGSDITILQPAP